MIELPDGLTSRVPTLDDIDVITELVITSELDANGVADVDRDDFRPGPTPRPASRSGRTRTGTNEPPTV